MKAFLHFFLSPSRNRGALSQKVDGVTKLWALLCSRYFYHFNVEIASNQRLLTFFPDSITLPEAARGILIANFPLSLRCFWRFEGFERRARWVSRSLGRAEKPIFRGYHKISQSKLGGGGRKEGWGGGGGGVLAKWEPRNGPFGDSYVSFCPGCRKREGKIPSARNKRGKYVCSGIPPPFLPLHTPAGM